MIWLGVWDRNLQARKFYERCGYKKIGMESFIWIHLGKPRAVEHHRQP